MLRRISLLMFSLILLVPIASAEAPWGETLDGVRTRLTSLDKEHKIGKPIRLRLELMNAGSSTVYYDSQQVEVNNSILIIDPNGKELPYIAGSFQTSGGAEPLGSEKVAVLFDGFEVDRQYCLAKPGKYSIRFRGLRGDKLQGDEKEMLGNFFPDTVAIPASNTLSIDLKPGKPSLATLFADRLFSILPKGWEIDRLLSYPIPPPGESRPLVLEATMVTCTRKVLHKEASPLILSRGFVCQRTKRGEGIGAGVRILVLGQQRDKLDKRFIKSRKLDRGRYLGKSLLGYVHGRWSGNLEKFWPDFEEQLGQALEIVD